MARVVVFGNSDWADLAHLYLTQDSPHEVVAFTVDKQFLKANEHRGLPVVPFEDVVTELPPDSYEMFLPISYKDMNRLRADKYRQAKAWGYRCISYISSKASIWSELSCGENCFIAEGNVIQPFVRIGNNVAMMSGNHIGHHSVIENHVTLTCRVVVAGHCTIKPYCFLGANATIRDGIVVAERTLVGAGALVLDDTLPDRIYKALPTGVGPMRHDGP